MYKRQLQELPDLATYVTPNGDIEYYDSYEELELNKQSKGLKNRNATIGLYYYTVMIYEHADFNTKRMGLSRALNAPLDVYKRQSHVYAKRVIFF